MRATSTLACRAASGVQCPAMIPARTSSATTVGSLPARYNVRSTLIGPTALRYVSVHRSTRR